MDFRTCCLRVNGASSTSAVTVATDEWQALLGVVRRLARTAAGSVDIHLELEPRDVVVSVVLGDAAPDVVAVAEQVARFAAISTTLQSDPVLHVEFRVPLPVSK